MAALRFLLVTHAPLSREQGAAQLALNLSDGLRALGHEVTVWSPHPVESAGRWWAGLFEMRAKLDEFIRHEPKFDVIDLPASLVTATVGRSAFVVVRSVQPDLRYLFAGLWEGLGRLPLAALRLAHHALQAGFQAVLVLQGWRRAGLVVCLGQIELRWMRKYFPMLRDKLGSYVVSPGNEDREALRRVRERRRPRDPGAPLRMLWIGRWVRHKGPDTLVVFAQHWLSVRTQDELTIAGCGVAAPKGVPTDLIDSGRIKVVPDYSRDMLPALLESHDVGLFTSRVEGWGLSLNEMLESGMPVYATEAGGVPDLSAMLPGCVRAFPPDDRPDAGIGSVIDPDWEAFERGCNWTSIAGEYEQIVEKTMLPIARASPPPTL